MRFSEICARGNPNSEIAFDGDLGHRVVPSGFDVAACHASDNCLAK
jgi:hypothetical protein